MEGRFYAPVLDLSYTGLLKFSTLFNLTKNEKSLYFWLL